eukprot:Tamp_21847.p1 GENE.Tamp_21847~~Tamp_21847.p1  ORF type:complete len:176 (+),score=29.71 Tamp_21847:420-947(+)
MHSLSHALSLSLLILSLSLSLLSSSFSLLPSLWPLCVCLSLSPPTQSHLSFDSGHNSGVLRAAGGALGLNAMAEASDKDKNAKPLNQALTSFVKAKDPKTAWSHAIILVSIIGGTVVSLTAVGTYFIAKAESKRLKKAKKNSNLLGGRYGAVKGEDDSDDEPPPVYEPMQMTDIV